MKLRFREKVRKLGFRVWCGGGLTCLWFCSEAVFLYGFSMKMMQWHANFFCLEHGKQLQLCLSSQCVVQLVCMYLVGRQFDFFVLSCGGNIAIWFQHESDMLLAHGFFLFTTWEATIIVLIESVHSSMYCSLFQHFLFFGLFNCTTEVMA